MWTVERIERLDTSPVIVVWKHLGWGAGGGGLEHLVVEPRSADSVLAWVDEEGAPFRLRYHATWDEGWTFRSARLAIRTLGGARELRVERDPGGEWTLDGVVAPALAGCTDIDVWPTPFTNTLPIRRLHLRPGESGEVRVAWVLAPRLSVQPRAQRYTRLEGGVYRFESLDDGFRADLETDSAGLVLRYPGLFERLA